MTSIVGLLCTLIRSIILLMLNILLLPVSVLNTLIAVIFRVEAEIVSIVVTVLYFSFLAHLLQRILGYWHVLCKVCGTNGCFRKRVHSVVFFSWKRTSCISSMQHRSVISYFWMYWYCKLLGERAHREHQGNVRIQREHQGNVRIQIMSTHLLLESKGCTL